MAQHPLDVGGVPDECLVHNRRPLPLIRPSRTSR